MNEYTFYNGLYTFKFIEKGYGDARRSLNKITSFPEDYKCVEIKWDV